MDFKSVLIKNEFKFNKNYGQNFISDTNLLNAIVKDSGISKCDTVLEIGAGAGSLTRILCEKAKRVVAFEIDTNLRSVLAETLGDFDNVEVHFEDALKADIAKIDEMMGEKYHIIANLPYYITTPLIMKFLENTTNVLSYTIMVQKEVAERLTAKHNTEQYGAITVAIDSVSDAKLTRIVDRRLFYPVPNVDSAIVNIQVKPNKYDISNMEIFRRVYKSAFQMRRKTLVNNLSNDFNFSKQQAKDILTQLGINENIRGEALSTGQLVSICNMISKMP